MLVYMGIFSGEVETISKTILVLKAKIFQQQRISLI
jgi:hypothetical protein